MTPLSIAVLLHGEHWQLDVLTRWTRCEASHKYFCRATCRCFLVHTEVYAVRFSSSYVQRDRPVSASGHEPRVTRLSIRYYGIRRSVLHELQERTPALNISKTRHERHVIAVDSQAKPPTLTPEPVT
jgi:hypothetical protein